VVHFVGEGFCVLFDVGLWEVFCAEWRYLLGIKTLAAVFSFLLNCNLKAGIVDGCHKFFIIVCLL
jgi:hypothetical protein